jgi:hypothetical protein
MDAADTPGGIHDPTKHLRHALAQIVIALVLGLTAFLAFAVLRVRYPKIYVANFNHFNRAYVHSLLRQRLPRLPLKLLFGWIPVLYRIDEQQVLDHAGLDAVVFLSFFKMCIRILAVCVVLAVTIITPVRYAYTRRLDDDEAVAGGSGGAAAGGSGAQIGASGGGGGTGSKPLPSYPPYLWMYTVFTYVFTGVVTAFLFDQTTKIIRKRQAYLGRQNSITDRTIKLIGIPALLRDEDALSRHIERLGIGLVDLVLIVREWGGLNTLFKLRARVLRRLECYWVEFFRRNGIINKSEVLGATLYPSLGEVIGMGGVEGGAGAAASDYETGGGSDDETGGGSDDETASAGADSIADSIADSGADSVGGSASGGAAAPSLIDHISSLLSPSPSSSLLPSPTRPKIRTGLFGLFGPPRDAITHYTQQLEVVDREIARARARQYPATSAAFVTMKSVAQAQMIAQAVLDPQVNHLITNLAPAPHDVIWDNLCLTRRERNTRILLVTAFIGALSVLLVFPILYLATLLNIKTISTKWPRLGQQLARHPWAELLVTNLLPTYIFTLFNIVIPYFYVWILARQGFTLHSDEEIALVLKNFFYIFVNLFLVFTLAGTVLLTNTAEFASQFAQLLKRVLLFYVDLIILQGVGIFPYKLLLLGQLVKFPLTAWWCTTPRDYLALYKPPVFNFGLHLPQPILVLLITIIYLVLLTKILSAGLVYFVVGFFVSKYQLLYACVHPPHLTGKVWPLIFRRVILGLWIFQLTMVGNLALQRAYVCASFLAPLPLLTLAALWNFHKNYIPLLLFIALRAIEEEEPAAAGSAGPTLDERRELNKTYEYPHLVDSLDGPLVAYDANEVLLVDHDGLVRRRKVDDEFY